jgi:hypothetical protein
MPYGNLFTEMKENTISKTVQSVVFFCDFYNLSQVTLTICVTDAPIHSSPADYLDLVGRTDRVVVYGEKT